MEKLKYLFQPVRIGSMEVKNRIVMPAMEPGFGVDDEGCVTSQYTEFLVERARSQPGVIITGSAQVHPLGLPPVMNQVHLWDERVLPSLQEMVGEVHNYDVKFGVQ